MQILNWTIVFITYVPKIRFSRGGNLAPKFQSDLLEMKLNTKEYSRVLVPNLNNFFCKFSSLKGFFGPIRSRNFNVFCFKWNSVQSGVQMC